MRSLLFTGLLVVSATAMADLPGMQSAGPGSLSQQTAAQCDAVAAPAVAAFSRGPLSLALTASSLSGESAFYKDLYDITMGADSPRSRPAVVLQRMDNQSMQLEAGAGMRFSVPAAPMDLSFVVRNRTEMATTVLDGGAGALWGGSLRGRGLFGGFPERSGTSDFTMSGNGRTTTEAGFTLDHAFDGHFLDGYLPGETGGPFDVNAAFTAHRRDHYQYDVPVKPGYAAFYSEYYGIDEEQGFSLNAGVKKTFHGLDVALNVANLFPRGMDPQTDIYGLRTSASVATTVDCGFSVAQLDLDWKTREGLGDTPDQRYATARMAFSGVTIRQYEPRLQLGYRHDLIDNPASRATLGVGFSPTRRLDLNVSGTHARDGAYGVMAELDLQLE